MAAPVNISSLSLQVIGTLKPAIIALKQGSSDGNPVYDALKQLHYEIDAVYELTLNIHQSFSRPGFIGTIRGLQHEENIGILTSLARSLQGCLKEAQELLDLLAKHGLQAHDGHAPPARFHLRLGRRNDGIGRFERNFQDHKSTMQLAIQLLTTCRQMQKADDDAHQITELKVQIDKLQTAIEQISHHIIARQHDTNGDQDGDTQMVDDMKGIQTASVCLKKRATMHFEHLTSLTDDRKGMHSCVGQEERVGYPEQGTARQLTAAVVLGNGVTNVSHSRAMLTLPSNSSSIRSSEAARNTTSTRFSTLLHNQRRRSASSKEPIPMEVRVPSESPYPTVNHGQSSSSDDPHLHVPSVSQHDFEAQMASLLCLASEQGMGHSKPYSEDLIIRVADLLEAVGKDRWSERPRTYLVLRLLGEDQLMDNFIRDDFKDIYFPCTETTLPPCIKESGMQHNFLRVQRFVLSERSADLVSGGRHRHLHKSADAVFESLRVLGSGGFSIVDEVRLRSRLTLHEYARKRIDRSGAFTKNRNALLSFENEVHNLKRLTHEHLVKFVGSYTDKHYVGIIMQPVADIDLYRYLSNEIWTDDMLKRLRSWVGCLCSAVAYLHDNQCRHKDIKPHNILIKGENIMFADFGTAFDWTEFETDVTVGPPDAHTNLYAAPEVRQQRPRDTSSDVWSLGCIFLEIATVLSGFSLRQKSDFFASLDTFSTAYWLNHTGIRLWITKIRGEDASPTAPIFALTEKMMALDPDRRPTANSLVELLSLAPYRNAGYTRRCCFDDIHSDTTSWQGSDVEEEDIFETAYETSDGFTMSPAGAPVPQRRTSSPPTSACEESESEISHPPVSIAEQLDHSQINLSREKLEGSCNSSAYNQTTSTPRTMSVHLTPQNSKSASSIQQAGLPPSAPLGASPLIQSSANRGTGSVELGLAAESRVVEQALHRSHEELESLLIESKAKDPKWRSQLLPLISRGLSDLKGFDVLTIACKFGNTVICNEIVDEVMSVNPHLAESSSIFGNTALHYAAQKGRMRAVEQLLDNGASAGCRNLRGQTALHIALHAERQDVAGCLISSMSLKELEAVDDTGESAIHILCRQRNSASLMKTILEAGCKTTTRNLRGHTPLQICRDHSNTEMSGLLVRSSSVRGHDQNSEPIPRGEAYWRHYEDLDTTTCHCHWCQVCTALSRATEKLKTSFSQCPCPNHVTVFVKDTLSQRSPVETCLRHCLCKACVRGREHNKSRPPCGSPLSNIYLPLHESLPTDASSSLTLPDLSLRHTSSQSSAKSLATYPGHQHYDDLIIAKSGIRTSHLSQEEITAMVLSTLADAGFKGSKSYRKFPNDAARWIIDHHDADSHVAKLVEIVLDCGADINVTSRGKGLLTVAAEKGDLALIKLLLDRQVIIDPMDDAPSSETRSVVSKLRDRLTSPRAESRSASALRATLLHGQILACRVLLKAGADINRPESKESHNTLLHAAAARCSTRGDFIPLLLAHGALPNMTDDNGDTALHLVVKSRHLEATRLLLDSGANPNTVNKLGESPLGIAIRNESTTPGDSASGQVHSVVTLLLTYGADPHSTCNSYPCALFCSLLYGKRAIAQMLLDEYSATEDVHRLDEDGSGLLHYLAYLIDDHAGPLIDRILGYASDLNAQNIDGDTPLHAAAIKSNLTLAIKLVERKAIKSVQNRKGNTPLDFARSLRFRVVELEECLRGISTKRRKK